MKEKIIEFSKNYLIGFIISGIIFTGISVYALTFSSDDVSYDNKTSGLQATNVKAAIDEIYKLCK